MYKKIQNVTVAIFVISVVILTFLAILAIWDVVDKEVLSKSFTTMGVLGFSSLVILIAARAVEQHQNSVKPLS